MGKAIEIQRVSKKYEIYHEGQNGTTFVDILTQKGKNLLNRLKTPLSYPSQQNSYEEFWALDDVNFDINEGDRVGIIGKNGAGKSTLLKILSRITEPTLGKVKIRGRVSSLLEVGTGFHPELTGRENIYLNGAILGMTRKEIRKNFDEIVAFSEVEKFLDTPVKRFSSGMYMRLGFAIAAYLSSDLLIIDEVLAVGDAQFQAKCFSKLNDLGNQGRTVLFVSHNIGSVLSLCNRGLYLDKGKVVESGDIHDCVNEYMKTYKDCSLGWDGDVGDEHIRITRASLEGSNEFFYHGDKPKLRIEYEVLKPNPDIFMSVGVWNMRHQLLAHTQTYEGFCQDPFSLIGKQSLTMILEPELFHEGEYLIKLNCSIFNKKRISEEEIVLKFPVFAKAKNTRFKHALESQGVSLGKSWEWQRHEGKS